MNAPPIWTVLGNGNGNPNASHHPWHQHQFHHQQMHNQHPHAAQPTPLMQTPQQHPQQQQQQTQQQAQTASSAITPCPPTICQQDDKCMFILYNPRHFLSKTLISS